MFWHLRDLQATDRNLERFKTDKKALDTWIKGQANLLEEIEEVMLPLIVWLSVLMVVEAGHPVCPLDIQQDTTAPHRRS